MKDDVTLKEYLIEALNQDVDWLKKQLPDMSDGLVALLSYRLGCEAYAALKEGVEKDNLAEGEKKYDEISQKMECVIDYLNRREFGTPNPSELATGNTPVTEWLKSGNL